MTEHHERNGNRPRLGPVIIRVLLAVALGLVIGALGTAVHRYGDESWYAGVVLALALTAAAAIMCRAWSGYGALLAFAGGWVVAVQLMSLRGSGGDVLVPAGTLGLVWAYGGVVLLGAAAFLPASWFREEPMRGWEEDPAAATSSRSVTSTEPPLGAG
ncbi:DUF6113 family protein [Myceligenerans xiligouense]|uniref:N-acetyl-1-D-myo-inositol-2-amino-2-deoxy-alpha-D-glucopyranoside deacetylase n=1 Tax=Myceligenerans xiligouense TaxID=253184 RepID=A0A3N4Z4U1_9MICO|nr:DUF6113 family protein [Myceligenerans xiligouense]RPF20232.1 hypothetical protein EDD34_0811 [Myceligenerans xiligouense]